MQLDRILFATDLSPAAARALPHVAALARLHGADVTVGHVVDTQGSTRRATPAVLDASAEARLMETLAALRGDAGRVRRQVLMGDPEIELLRMLDYGEYDLCVCTKHGQRAAGLLVGSTSQRLVELAHVPVLVVHGPADASAPLARRVPGWTDAVVATDFSPPSEAGMRDAVELARRWGARLHFVHVVTGPGLAVVEGDSVALPEVPEPLRDEVARRELRLAELLRSLTWSEISHAVVCADEAATGLIAAALRTQADAILIPSRGAGAVQRFVLGSTSARLLRLSPLPVLVLRG